MDTPQTNIQFHFDTTDVSDGLEWIRLGQSAVEEAKEELQDLANFLASEEQ